MTWEWSHTQEAYENARERVFEMNPVILAIIHAEWETSIFDDTDCNSDEWQDAYDYNLSRARHLEPDVLANLVWDRAEEQRICTNGGFSAWVCPYGCHTVPFSPVLGN